MTVQRYCFQILSKAKQAQSLTCLPQRFLEKPNLQTRCLYSESKLLQSNKQGADNEAPKKLIYEGSLAKRILYLKSLSILSSLGLASSYGYVISQKGFSVALAGVGFAFTPFLLSPFVIAWFFKRYITQLYYDPEAETFTLHHYGLLLNKKSRTFKKEDVIRSDVTSMLNTF